jgi:hypothetical protein
VNADGARHATGPAAEQRSDEKAIDELDAFRLQRAPEQPGKFEPAVRVHHARKIEPARRTALVAAAIIPRELHADSFEVLQPRK